MLNLIQKSLDGDRPAKISIISVDELSGGGQGVGWEAGIIGGNYQTLLKMSEKKLFLLYATRHSHYVQQKKQYNQTVKPQENSIICFFCDDGTCRKTQKKDGSREYKEHEAVGLEPEPGTPLYRPPYRYVPPRRVWLWRRFGLRTDIDFAHFGLESGMVHKGTTVVYECVRRFNYK